MISEGHYQKVIYGIRNLTTPNFVFGLSMKFVIAYTLDWTFKYYMQ